MAGLLTASPAIAAEIDGPRSARHEVTAGVDLVPGPAPVLKVPVWAARVQAGAAMAPWLHLQVDLRGSPAMHPPWLGFDDDGRRDLPEEVRGRTLDMDGGPLFQGSATIRLAATLAHLGHARRRTELRLGVGRAMLWSRYVDRDGDDQLILDDRVGRPANEIGVEVVRPLGRDLALAGSVRMLTASPLDEASEPGKVVVALGASVVGQLGSEGRLPGLARGEAPDLASELVFAGSWETGQEGWRAALPVRQTRLRLGLRASRLLLVELELLGGAGLFGYEDPGPSWFEGTGVIPPPRAGVVQLSWPTRYGASALLALCPEAAPLPGHTWFQPRLRAGMRMQQVLIIREYASEEPDLIPHTVAIPGFVAGIGGRVVGRSRAGLDLDLRLQSRTVPDEQAAAGGPGKPYVTQVTMSFAVGVAVSLGKRGESG